MLDKLFTNIAWTIYLGVVVFNIFGVIDIPWVVALVPFILSGVITIITIVSVINNAEKIEKMMKERKK